MLVRKNVKTRVTEFERIRGQFESLRLKIEPLVKEILDANSINYQLVESRTKSVESFTDKLKNPNKKYSSPLTEMPDLCGCRIIVYYHDDVARVSDIIKNEFHVIEEELSHQAKSIQADRFGYLSLHYVVKISDTRSSLVEWSGLAELHAEIQIRTVVQHAWSAVSHALQYKQETEIPSKLQRRLYRIAGLFELADEEFVGIRDQRLALDRAASELLKSGETKIPLTSSSIKAFAAEWFASDGLKNFLFDVGYVEEYDEDEDAESYIGDIYDIASRLNLTTISELAELIDFDPREYLEAVVKNDSDEEIPVSDTFCLLLVAMAAAPQLITLPYMLERGWGPDRAKNILAQLKRLTAGKKIRPK